MQFAAVILGSGTAVPVAARGAASYLIICGNERMMFDCGPGSTRKLAQAGYALTDLDRVFISHFHTDHINDLAAIIFGSRIQGYERTRTLELIGPVGLQAHFDKLKALYGRWLDSDKFAIQITELNASAERAVSIEFANCTVRAQLVAHSFPALGYRIESAQGAICYSGDTDYCAAIVSLCENAELAILDCAAADEFKIKGHLTPGLAGQIATEAGIKHLVLSHFYPNCEGADLIGQCRRNYRGKISLAEDLMRFTLT